MLFIDYPYSINDGCEFGKLSLRFEHPGNFSFFKFGHYRQEGIIYLYVT